MRRTSIALLLVLVGTVALACGGDESGGSSTGADAGSGGDADAFCTASQDFARAIGSGGDSPDFDAMSDALAEMESNAPDEIKADVTAVKEALDGAVSGDAPDAMSDPEVQDSNDRIFEYLEDSDCEPPEDA